MLHQPHRSTDVQVNHPLEVGEIAVEELLTARVGARVVDQQPDLEIGGRVEEPVDGRRVDEINLRVRTSTPRWRHS